MKKILLAILLLCSTSWYSLAQSWIEYKRTDADHKSIAYKDTIFIYHLQPDSVSLRLNGFMYNNRVVDHKFDLTFTDFLVIKSDTSEIVLKRRDKTLSYFKKRMVSNQPTLVKPINELAEKIKRKDRTPITIDDNLLHINWKAYKRESSTGPIPNLDFKTLIKRVELKNATPELLGYMKLGTESGFLYQVLGVEKGQFKVKDPQGKIFLFHIYALSQHELVFEDQRGMVYYCNKE